MEKQFKYRDINVNYSVQGEGKSVMLIHGFCESQAMWESLSNQLCKQYKVITPDLPGYGKSTYSLEEMSITWMAEMMHAILKEEGLQSTTMMGHSLGGYIAIHFAELYPNQIEALGFINSHVFNDDDEKKINRTKSIDFIKKHTARLFIRELINNLFSDDYKLNHKDVVLSLIKEAQESIHDLAIIASLHAMAQRDDKQEVLKKFTKPVLFLIGEIDATIPIEQSLAQISLASQSDIHIRPKIAHMSMYEDSQYSIEAIAQFLKRNNGI